MTIDILQKRLEALKGVLEQARHSVTTNKEQMSHFAEQLEQAKTHFNIVSGHVTEISFLISEEARLIEEAKAEEQRLLEEAKAEEAKQEEKTRNLPGEENGKVDKQDKKQTPKK